MEKKNVKSKVWIDLLTGEDLDRAVTRVDDKSNIQTSIVDIEYDSNGNRIAKERSVKKWK